MIRAMLVVKHRLYPGLHSPAYPLINLFFYPYMNLSLPPSTFLPMLPSIGGLAGGRTSGRPAERAGGRAGGPFIRASTHPSFHRVAGRKVVFRATLVFKD